MLTKTTTTTTIDTGIPNIGIPKQEYVQTEIKRCKACMSKDSHLCKMHCSLPWQKEIIECNECSAERGLCPVHYEKVRASVLSSLSQRLEEAKVAEKVVIEE